MASSNLTAKTLHSVTWTTAATVATAVMQIGYTAVMARLLTAADFGLVALGGVVLRFGGYFAQMGMEQAIIQKPELSTEDVRAAFTSSVLLGLLFAGALALGAPLAELFFHEPAVVPLVRVMALGILVTGISATALSILRRRMVFRTLAIIEVTTYVIGYGGLGIGLAWQGFGVWSLVWASLGQSMLMGLLAYGATRHSLRPFFDWAHYRPLVAYGSRISAISFLEFITSSLDTMTIGRVLGATLLGIYNRAWMLISLPLYLLTTSVSKVIFPAFSQVQTNVAKMRTVYLASVTLVAAVVLPVCAGVAAAAPELVRTLLGPNWDASIPILRVLAGAVGLSLLTMFAGIVCDARAQLQQKIWITLGTLATLLALFWLLRGFGLLGFAAALVLNELLRTALYLRLIHRDLAISYARLLTMYLPGLAHAVAVGGTLLGVGYLLGGLALPPIVGLAAQMLAGALVLGLLLLVRPMPVLRRQMHEFLSRLNGNPNGRVQRWLAWYTRFLAPEPEFAPDLPKTSSPVLP